jgi:shikimate dehydrogenase
MDKYGLIGYPLGHSFSKGFFTDKFASEGINAEYVNFELPSIEDFPEIISAHKNIKGLNVTIPYKEKVIPYLDSISKEAREIGAVNVVKVERRGNHTRLTGYNSDVIGFMGSIEPLLKPHHKKALILGTGGSSKAVHYALTQKLGLETVFVSRYERPDTVTY